MPAPGGRFVEIGKRGIWEAAAGRRRPSRRGVPRPLPRRHVRARARAACRRCSSTLAAEFAAGRLSPLPYRVYPTERRRRLPLHGAGPTRRQDRPDAAGPGGRRARAGRRNLSDHRRPGRARSADRASGCTSVAPGTWSSWDADAAPGGDGAVGTAHAGRRRGASNPWRRGARRGRARGARRDRPHAAAPARRRPRRGRARRRGCSRARVAPRFDAVLAPKVAGAWNLHARRAALAARLLRPLLVVASAARLAGPGELRGGERLPRRAGGSPARPRAPALAIDWGPWREGRHGREPRRARPTPLGRPGSSPADSRRRTRRAGARAGNGRRPGDGGHHRLVPLPEPAPRWPRSDARRARHSRRPTRGGGARCGPPRAAPPPGRPARRAPERPRCWPTCGSR